MSKVVISQPKAGRPMNSRNIRVFPDFHVEPDIEKLGHALIAVALTVSNKKKLDKHTVSCRDNRVNGYTSDKI